MQVTPTAQKSKEVGLKWTNKVHRKALAIAHYKMEVSSHSVGAEVRRKAICGKPQKVENQPFVMELLSRLGTSVDDLSNRTSIPAEKIVDLLTKELPEEFRQLCSIAKALEVPMDIFFPKNGNA